MRDRRPRRCAGVVPCRARPASRRDPHARDRVHLPPGARRPARGRRHRRRPRARPVHRAARRRLYRQSDGAGVAGARHRRLEPRPARLRGALHQPVGGRRDRCSSRRAVLRVLPAGAGWGAAPVRVSDGRAERRRVGAAGAGRGVPRRRRRRAPLPRGVRGRGPHRVRHCRQRLSVGRRPRRAHPSACAARGVRAAVGGGAALPAPGRRRGQLGAAPAPAGRGPPAETHGLMVAAPERDLGLHVQLVPMRRRHLRSVLRIESQVYPRPWSLSLFMSELALRSTRSYLVARVEGSVVGYAGLMMTGDDGHVTTIAVDPVWHRHKIATRLLLAVAREARRRGAANLTLEVRMSNAGAQAMYRKFGFRPAGVRKNYYVESNEDALVMWADEVDTDDYTVRLDGLELEVTGTTTFETPANE